MTGYGDGVTGYLGAMAGNGFGKCQHSSTDADKLQFYQQFALKFSLSKLTSKLNTPTFGFESLCFDCEQRYWWKFWHKTFFPLRLPTGYGNGYGDGYGAGE